jgi:hypothetical protein
MAKNDQPGLSDLPSMRKFVPNRRDDADPFSMRPPKLPVTGTQAVQNFGNASEQKSAWQGGRDVSASATRTTTAMSGVKPKPQDMENRQPGWITP